MGQQSVTKRAWLVWSVGALAYVIAILNRTSFGVVGVEAAHRFQSGASIISLFVVLQIFTYAVMQIPSGVLADRFGPRIVIGTGALLMCLGQIDLAFANTLPSAIIGRILVGMGDSMTFGPVNKLLPAWFPDRYVPLLTQTTASLGQLGQVLSSVPLVLIFGRYGWTSGFMSAAATTVVVAILVLSLLRNSPEASVQTSRADLDAAPRSIMTHVRSVIRRPGTQLGYWSHWLAGLWHTVFAMMWGFPFLNQGQGLSAQQAGLLMATLSLAAATFGPFLGLLTQRHPLRRSDLVLMVASLSVVPWIAVLLWPGRAPVWLLIVLVVCIGAGSPGSTVGFEIARRANPYHQGATATGVVIMGSFTASLVNVWVIGLVLDLSGGDFSTRDFKLAMATQLLFAAIGFVGFMSARRRARAEAREQGYEFEPWTQIMQMLWRGDRRI